MHEHEWLITLEKNADKTSTSTMALFASVKHLLLIELSSQGLAGMGRYANMYDIVGNFTPKGLL